MGNTGKKRVCILSLDAVGRKDMEFMLSLPNFSRIVREGFFCDKVFSTYPSLTYPAHTSIITGKVPARHGIVSNTLLQPARETPDWLYKHKYIDGPTLYDVAKKKGYTVASLLWPVTGGAKIDYNIPEIMVTRKLQNQVVSCLVNGSPRYLLELNKRFGHLRKGIEQPYLDNFVMASAEYTIRKYDPDLLLVHLTDVDTNRHNLGADAPEIKEALERHDERIGNLQKWLSETRPMDDTVFIVLGDHCQIDASKIVYLNKLFADRGLLTVKDGYVADYKAVTKSCDGSAYVYINEKYASNDTVLETVIDVLNEIKGNKELGIEEIYTGEEAAEMGADPDCFAMIEAERGYYFLDEARVLTESVKDTKNHRMFAIHGCSPLKEENITFFAGCGAGIKKGSRKESMHLWDEGPTIAKLMGLYLPGADGEIVKEMLE